MFKMDASNLVNGLNKLENKSELAIRMFAETAAKQMEGDAKRQAKWTDRTGAARRGLYGDTSQIRQGIRIRLSHTVWYGVYLELAHEKKYAIVGPIVDLSAPFIMEDFNHFLDKL